MEEKVLVKVLTQISNNETPTAAPDDDYLKGLKAIGFINMDWDITLTALGRKILNTLR